MEANEIEKLIDKYLAGSAVPEESALIEEWYEQIDTNPKRPGANLIKQYKKETHKFLSWYIRRNASYPQKQVWLYKWMAAALLLFALGTTLYFYGHRSAGRSGNQHQLAIKNDAFPGGNKAILTLTGGHQIILAGTGNGLVAKQEGIAIHKTGDGKLYYETSPETNPKVMPAEAYNTMTTPRGGNYHIILEDGTGVWLNSASSIKYPVIFKGKERVVYLTGEAYFEVAKNKAMPFKVNIAGETVEVLGTHFNINGYANEKLIKTTLLEGSVKISAGAKNAVLKPGEQGIYDLASDKAFHITNTVNMEEVMAWKNGKFFFAGADIKTVMRQLERWYDVEAVYDGNLPSDHFNGKIPKNVNLSQALKVLELSGVHFKIEGRKIIIR